MNDTPERAPRPPDESIWARGGGWVLTQFPLVGLAIVGALAGPRLPLQVRGLVRRPGLLLIAAGGALFLAGAAGLGRNLTPFPRPRPDGILVRGGAYALVRHPIYGGGLMAMAGWALFHGRWLGLAGLAALTAFFDAKATREEGWLVERFPEYATYRRRVRKLIPFLY